MQKEFLIVGAGITGSLTASLLFQTLPGVSLTVWDKARGTGGRMSTHRHPSFPSLQADMGAQYISRFQTSSKHVTKFVELKEAVYSELLSSDTLVPFNGSIEGLRPTPYPVISNYVAPGGLSRVAKYFIAKSQAKTCFQHRLSTVNVDCGLGKVVCSSENGSTTVVDGVVLTMPVLQILQIAGNLLSCVAPETKAELSSVQYSSRYALGLFYTDGDSVPEYPWTSSYIDHEVIRYISWDSSKHSSVNDTNKNKTSLLIHTTVPFAVKHLEVDKDKIQDMMLEALKDVLPGLPNPSHSHLIRWRYSQVSRPYSGCPGYVVLCQHPLVVATGDGFSESSFEGCLRAAHETVNGIYEQTHL